MATNAPAAQPLLRPAEAAERLAVSLTTLRRLVRSGEVPALRVGGSLRFDPQELADYLYGDAEAFHARGASSRPADARLGPDAVTFPSGAKTSRDVA